MLSSFYRSKPWIDLMAVIRLERGNICEHCGKPIVKKYDAIGHHIIELTEENVEDANISLNPDNIMLVHHRCHNIIHNKLGINAKQVYLVYGSPCSGKTTYVRENMNAGDLIIDMDNIWQCISGQQRYSKPNRLKGVAFMVRDNLIDAVRVRRGNWLNAYIIGGYPLIGERERLIKALDAREIFIDTSKEDCIINLHNNPENRDIPQWENFIFDWWEKFLPSPTSAENY